MPADATAFSALGMLTADLAHSFEQGAAGLDPVRRGGLRDDGGGLRRPRAPRPRRSCARRARTPAGATLRRSLLMRFRAQVHEIEIDVPAEISLDADGIAALIERFTARYEQTYGEGSAYPDAGVEITTFRLTATIPTSVGELPRLAPAAGDAADGQDRNPRRLLRGRRLPPDRRLRRRAPRRPATGSRGRR